MHKRRRTRAAAVANARTASAARRGRAGGVGPWPILGLAAWAALSRPAPAETPADVAVAPVVVVAMTPLAGLAIDIDKAPANIAVLSAADLASYGPANLTQAIGERLAGVTLGDNLDDPLQPDILYRGFTASPVLGTPEGLAVYQNGVRINEAFGDAVNWDMIPDQAIRRVTVAGSNPVYGLNALGGAVVIDMKTGFSDPGASLALSGGSFGRREAAVDYGARSGDVGLYLAARALAIEGWRMASPDLARQVYASLGVRPGRFSLELTFTGADNRLGGESAAPVQELAVNRALVFTRPQSTADRLAFATLDVGYRASPTLSFQAVAFVRRFRQSLVNGNTTGVRACVGPADSGLLCQADGLTLLNTASKMPIPDLSRGGAAAIGELDRETLRSLGVGASLQASQSAPLFGRPNSLTFGVGLDRAVSDFSSSVEIGTIDAALRVQGSGLLVSTPEGGAFTATPVALRAVVEDQGVWFADTLEVTGRWSISLSGRDDRQRESLRDRLGSALTGGATYARFNPAAGFAYRLSSALTAYAGYAEANRAPSPSEIECADPARPCLLPSSLASDPPTLKPVVSRTWEAGLRGVVTPPGGGRLAWRAGAFRADLTDDIWAVATTLGAGYFRNIGATRRQGLELSADYSRGGTRAFASYALVDATFRTPFAETSPANPAADPAGDILVRAGDRLPGIPRHRLKAGVDRDFGSGWSAGASVSLVSSQFYHGDEANALAPLPGHAVVSLRGAYRWRRGVEVFASVQNLLGARYATFGALGDATGVGAPGVPAIGADPRFQSPAAPLAISGGIRARF